MSSLEQYVVALDFGYPSDPKQRSTIDDLADFIVRNYADEPKTVVLAQEFIYAALLRRGFPRERLLEVGTGQSNTNGLESGGSYHMLREATGMIRELAKDDFGTRPLTDDLGPGRAWPPIAATVVAHALHVRRVVRQGRLFGLQLAPPPRSYQRHFIAMRRNGGVEVVCGGICGKLSGSFPCDWRGRFSQFFGQLGICEVAALDGWPLFLCINIPRKPDYPAYAFIVAQIAIFVNTYCIKLVDFLQFRDVWWIWQSVV